jgi:hypothetical protein
MGYKEKIKMATEVTKKNTKRLSKSQRTHIRRLKQEAGKTGPLPK